MQPAKKKRSKKQEKAIKICAKNVVFDLKLIRKEFETYVQFPLPYSINILLTY